MLKMQDEKESSSSCRAARSSELYECGRDTSQDKQSTLRIYINLKEFAMWHAILIVKTIATSDPRNGELSSI